MKFGGSDRTKNFSVILKLWKKEGKRSGIKFFENLILDSAIFGWKKDFKILNFFSLNYENFRNLLLDTTKGIGKAFWKKEVVIYISTYVGIFENLKDMEKGF